MERLFSYLRKGMKYEKMVCGNMVPNISGKSVLSVGCGDGSIESMMQDALGIEVTGVEVTRYSRQDIRIELYDGKTLPFPDNSFDTTIFVYVLHHTNNIEGLLREAARVTRKRILILDHIYTDRFDRAMLKAYDYLANLPYGIPVPFNFRRVGEWNRLFRKLNVKVEKAEITMAMNVFFSLGVGQD